RNALNDVVGIRSYVLCTHCAAGDRAQALKRAIMGKGHLLAVGILGSALLAAGPAFAQHGGGGHAGGGHAGGGHVSAGHAGGGAHYAAPSHFAGSRSYAGGMRSYGSY